MRFVESLSEKVAPRRKGQETKNAARTESERRAKSTVTRGGGAAGEFKNLRRRGSVRCVERFRFGERAKEVGESTVGVVVNFEVYRFERKQHRRRTAERLDVNGPTAPRLLQNRRDLRTRSIFCANPTKRAG